MSAENEKRAGVWFYWFIFYYSSIIYPLKLKTNITLKIKIQKFKSTCNKSKDFGASGVAQVVEHLP
jgi:hypothetical protein